MRQTGSRKQGSIYPFQLGMVDGFAAEAPMNVGYARVSTRDQTVALQVDALKAAGCAKVHTEVVGGAAAERPILARLLNEVRPGDVVMIWKLDRLGRSLKHLIEIVNGLMQHEVGLKSLNDPR